MHLESFTEHNLAAVMSCLVIRRGERTLQESHNSIPTKYSQLLVVAYITNRVWLKITSPPYQFSNGCRYYLFSKTEQSMNCLGKFRLTQIEKDIFSVRLFSKPKRNQNKRFHNLASGNSDLYW